MGGLLTALWVAAAPHTQHPDSAKAARVERVITATSDSISRLRSAAYGFRLDLQAVSPSLVLERAQRVHNGCTGAVAGLESLLRVLTAEPLTPRARPEQAPPRIAALHLRRTLPQSPSEGAP